MPLPAFPAHFRPRRRRRPGAHARWLIKDGYTVHLIDPVPRHVDQATATGASAELGDARALNAADNTYDIVLPAGPALPPPGPRRPA